MFNIDNHSQLVLCWLLRLREVERKIFFMEKRDYVNSGRGNCKFGKGRFDYSNGGLKVLRNLWKVLEGL